MKQQAFVYKWTHIPTMKWYIGSRTAKKCHPADGYICSSKIVKPMILESRDDWKREIIAIGKPKDMTNFEALILSKLDAKNDSNSFNLHNGDGKFSMTGQIGGRAGKDPWNKGKNTGLHTSTEFQKGHNTWNKGLYVRLNPDSEFQKGHTPWNKGLPAMEQPGYGYKHSDKNKLLFSEQKKGKQNPMFGKDPWNKGKTTGYKWYNNGKDVKLFAPGKEPKGFILGRKISEKSDKI